MHFDADDHYNDSLDTIVTFGVSERHASFLFF